VLGRAPLTHLLTTTIHRLAGSPVDHLIVCIPIHTHSYPFIPIHTHSYPFIPIHTHSYPFNLSSTNTIAHLFTHLSNSFIHSFTHSLIHSNTHESMQYILCQSCNDFYHCIEDHVEVVTKKDNLGLVYSHSHILCNH
jgi:hypothetical protein